MRGNTYENIQIRRTDGRKNGRIGENDYDLSMKLQKLDFMICLIVILLIANSISN